MVVKPMDFIATGKRDLVQPAMKCRGPECLRIIYGPEYTLPEIIEHLEMAALHEAVDGASGVCIGSRRSQAFCRRRASLLGT